MGSIRKRTGAVLGTAALFAGAALTAGTANAADTADTGDLTPEVAFEASAAGFSSLSSMEADGSVTINVVGPGGRVVGYARWNADPQPAPNIPGDALIAKDTYADGYAVEAELEDGRLASTKGHRSPYMKIVPGDLREGTPIKVRACFVRGDSRQCSQWYNGHA